MADHNHDDHSHEIDSKHDHKVDQANGGHGSHGSHGGHGGHGHHHGPANYNAAFVIGITLNLGFVLVEGFYGYFAQSLALFADAGHNLSDVLGLIIAWVASILAKRRPSKRYTYGLRSSSILAALFNAIFLLVAVGGIIVEAIQRFGSEAPIPGVTVMIVAGIGVVVNGVTAMLFMSGGKGDLNIRGAYLHMLADAAVSVGVVIGGFIILKTGWYWIDPVLSIVIGFVIVLGTWHLLRDSLDLALKAVPLNIDFEVVEKFLTNLPGVRRVHDLHIWGMSTTEAALTAHLVIPDGHPGDKFLADTSRKLGSKYGINHTTLQIEVGDCADPCTLEPADVV